MKDGIGEIALGSIWLQATVPLGCITGCVLKRVRATPDKFPLSISYSGPCQETRLTRENRVIEPDVDESLDSRIGCTALDDACAG